MQDEFLKRLAEDTVLYVRTVCNTIIMEVPKAIVHCQVCFPPEFAAAPCGTFYITCRHGIAAHRKNLSILSEHIYMQVRQICVESLVFQLWSSLSMHTGLEH